MRSRSIALKQTTAILALVVFFSSSVTGGFVVVFCPKSECEAGTAVACHSAESTECRPCCPSEQGCPRQKQCPLPEAEPDQTRVVLLPLLAVDACDMQSCSSVCTSSGLSDFREQQIPAKLDPGLNSLVTNTSFAFESPPPLVCVTSRPAGVHPHLHTVLLRC
jgi:hypothetical protein